MGPANTTGSERPSSPKIRYLLPRQYMPEHARLDCTLPPALRHLGLDGCAECLSAECGVRERAGERTRAGVHIAGVAVTWADGVQTMALYRRFYATTPESDPKATTYACLTGSRSPPGSDPTGAHPPRRVSRCLRPLARRPAYGAIPEAPTSFAWSTRSAAALRHCHEGPPSQSYPRRRSGVARSASAQMSRRGIQLSPGWCRFLRVCKVRSRLADFWAVKAGTAAGRRPRILSSPPITLWSMSAIIRPSSTLPGSPVHFNPGRESSPANPGRVHPSTHAAGIHADPILEARSRHPPSAHRFKAIRQRTTHSP